MTLIKSKCPECGKRVDVDPQSLMMLTGNNPYLKTVSMEEALELLSYCDLHFKRKMGRGHGRRKLGIARTKPKPKKRR